MGESDEKLKISSHLNVCTYFRGQLCHLPDTLPDLIKTVNLLLTGADGLLCLQLHTVGTRFWAVFKFFVWLALVNSWRRTTKSKKSSPIACTLVWVHEIRLQYFTFIVPCIVIFYGITNRCYNVQWNLFLCKSTLHVSGGTHAHQQEYNFNSINSHWYNSYCKKYNMYITRI